MYFVFVALTLVAGLVSFVCGIIILIHAFKESIGQGLLSFVCAPYLLYYALVKFQHERKGLILAGWFASIILAVVFQAVGTMFAIDPAPPQFNDDLSDF